MTVSSFLLLFIFIFLLQHVFRQHGQRGCVEWLVTATRWEELFLISSNHFRSRCIEIILTIIVRQREQLHIPKFKIKKKYFKTIIDRQRERLQAREGERCLLHTAAKYGQVREAPPVLQVNGKGGYRWRWWRRWWWQRRWWRWAKADSNSISPWSGDLTPDTEH